MGVQRQARGEERRRQLLREALEFWVAEEVSRLETVTAAIEREQLSPAEGAARWSELLRGNDPHQVAQFDLYLQAARDPSLRPAAAEAFAAYERVAAAALRAAGLEADPAVAAPNFVALGD